MEQDRADYEAVVQMASSMLAVAIDGINEEVLQEIEDVRIASGIIKGSAMHKVLIGFMLGVTAGVTLQQTI